MAEATTVLRFRTGPRPKCAFPGTDRAVPTKRPMAWADWQGRHVVVLLPPVKADPTLFNCDAQLVWRVERQWAEKNGITIPAGFSVVLCHHMVEVD